MKEAIIVALITSVTTILVNLLSSRQMTKDLYTKLDKQSELSDVRIEGKLETLQKVTDMKIEELTREVREHNNFAKRVPVLEEKVKNLEQRG